MKTFLKTPRGILFLFAATFFGAAILASTTVFFRPFFEKYVAEKYAPPTANEEKNLKQPDSPDNQKYLNNLPSPQKIRLYEVWMQQPDSFSTDIPQRLIRSSPDTILLRVTQTFVAGSHEQRQRAAVFLARSRDIAAQNLLENERQRAEVRREAELAKFIQQLQTRGESPK